MNQIADRKQDGPAVRAWLLFICVMIFIMIIVGGATRLTDSGLSITEWQPILGIIPPLSEEDWQAALALYRQIPEYQVVNRGMSLDEFKFIYWWEWAHRFLGRMIGFAFLIPFLWFAYRRQLSRGMTGKLAIMFVLGGLQGALGWYMVQSGLVERVDVSQYRLAAHLCAAVLIFGYIFWVAIRMGLPAPIKVEPTSGVRISAAILTLAVFIQIALGAFVAGLDAGQGYNTWPYMDGAIVPEGLWSMTPWHLNLFENAMTVQFNHRVFAYALVVHATIHAVYAEKLAGKAALGATVLAIVVLLQAGLGIATLLTKVPIGLGLMHQGTAIVVFALALMHLSQLTPRPDQDRR